MRTRIVRVLAVGLVALGVAIGCATQTVVNGGVPNAQNPEYLGHPLRLIALPLHLVGTVLQYTLVEPFYFLMNTAPQAVGLSLEEQRYLAQRQAEWEKLFRGERKLIE